MVQSESGTSLMPLMGLEGTGLRSLGRSSTITEILCGFSLLYNRITQVLFLQCPSHPFIIFTASLIL
jgi:hypothetical protein